MFNFQRLISNLKKSGQLKLKARPRGDTILEVVISTAILSIVMVATFEILQRAIDTNLNIKNRVVALNIAREGVEAVRNIRDTNWLKYSGDRRGKWLCHDTLLTPDACQGTTVATDFLNDNDESNDTYYKVDFDSGASRYYLTETTMQSAIDFLSSQPNREEFRLYLTAATPQRYTHTSTGNTSTIFYRQIYLDIQNPYDVAAPTFCDGAPTTEKSCTKARLVVISRVYWQEDSRQRSVTLETHLFDFFERDDY